MNCGRYLLIRMFLLQTSRRRSAKPENNRNLINFRSNILSFKPIRRQNRHYDTRDLAGHCPFEQQ